VCPAVEAWLSGGGEMGALIREHDWTRTPLRAIESWPQSLKTTLGILLNSRYPDERPPGFDGAPASRVRSRLSHSQEALPCARS
jgi:hypothetical protein